MTTRGLFFSSSEEIVSILISNYEIPRIINKIKIQDKFFLKKMGEDFMAICSANTFKIVFPDPRNWKELRVWMSKKIIHEAQISCLEYCGRNLGQASV